MRKKKPNQEGDYWRLECAFLKPSGVYEEPSLRGYEEF